MKMPDEVIRALEEYKKSHKDFMASVKTHPEPAFHLNRRKPAHG